MRQTNKASSPPSNFKKVGHVYLHPEDDTAFYSPVTFRNDPKKFRPLPREDPRFKEMRVYKWGFYELEDIMRDPDSDGETCYSDDKDYAEACSRMQMFRTMYGNKKIFWYHSFPNPEEQFINILIDRKLRYIKNHQAIQNACQHCSLTIKVSLHMNEEDVWRIIRVPASTSLAEMHDQVLVPAMGWSRCYHAYVFEDKQDGAAIGPQMNSGFVDMMWVKDNYKAFMDSRKVPLAALMRSVGDECLYLYDLGDEWRHRLKVISVTDIEGEENVEILDGRGACPPEDSVGLEGQGVESYHNFLQSYKSNANSLAVKEKLQEMSLAMNYTSHWLTGQAIPFKPLDYNLEFHRYVLRQMVEGPRMEKPPKYWDFSPDFNECAACKDRLKPLMACSQCKKVKYCRKECQRSDWKTHKPLCKLLAHSNK